MSNFSKKVLSDNIIFSLRKQARCTLDAIDCMCLLFLYCIHEKDISDNSSTDLISSLVLKSNKSRFAIMTSRINNKTLISAIDIGLANFLSTLFNDIISFCENIIYATLSISPIKLTNCIVLNFIKTCISATRICINVADNLIDGAEEMFTSRKITRIKNMISKARNLYPNVQSTFSSAISFIFKKSKDSYEKLPVNILFSVFSSIFSCFKTSFSMLSHISIEITKF